MSKAAIDEERTVSADPDLRPRIDRFVVPDELIDPAVTVHEASGGVRYVRTPDERFVALDGYPFEPHYLEVDGLRVHYVDEGPADGPTVLLLHGQPTWSYLYRKMIPPLVDAGMHVVAWDNIGFGRSDKPVDPVVHTFPRHVGWTQQMFDVLGLRGVHLFCQDWGGAFGLRLVGDNPDRFASVVAANTGLVVQASLDGSESTGISLPAEVAMASDPRRFIEAVRDDDPLSMASFEENFGWWVRYTLHSADLRAGDFVAAMTRFQISEAEQAGYDAPFPSFVYTMGPHTFPSMLPTITDDNAGAWEALGAFERPFLYLGGDFDNIGTPAVQARHVDHVPGAAGMPHERFAAGHFIQDELGAVMAERLLAHVERGLQ